MFCVLSTIVAILLFILIYSTNQKSSTIIKSQRKRQSFVKTYPKSCHLTAGTDTNKQTVNSG